MKHIFFLAVILPILFSGCKKVSYNNFKILNVKIIAIPFQDVSSADWDILSNPDVFFNIEDITSKPLLKGSHDRLDDVGKSDFPLSWDLQTEFQITDLDAVNFITVYDYDPWDPNDKIGEVSLKLRDYSRSYPESITKKAGELTITINGKWY